MVEEVQFKSEQPADPEGHDEAMVKLVDDANTIPEEGIKENVEVAAKPESVPDKFYNAETGAVDYDAMAKSYAELEKKQSGKQEEKVEESAEEPEAYSLTDGKEGYEAMSGWAKANLSEAELSNYNTQVNSPNSKIREQAIRGLHSQFASDSGDGKALVHGSGTQSSSTGGFGSRAQMIVAMQDSKYQSDPAYRAEVENKVSNSNF